MNKKTLTVYTDKDSTIRHFNADGQLHNENGPAVIYSNGDKEHWIDGELHNPNGPAVVYADGYKEHYTSGKLHNPDGPAIVYADGHKEYWINGKPLNKAEFKAWQAEQTTSK